MIFIILFLIQWIGGIYCAKKMGKNGIWVWLVCVIGGWLFIIPYMSDLIDNSKKSNSSTSINLSNTDTYYGGVFPDNYKIIRTDSQETENLSSIKGTYEKQVLEEINKLPRYFDYSTGITKSVNITYQTTLLNDIIDLCVYPQQVQHLKGNLQLKRQRSNSLQAYSESLLNNIFFELYKYDCMIKLFNIIETHKNKIAALNFNNFYTLVCEYCKSTFISSRNFAQYYPSVRQLLAQYSQTDIEQKEFDYIFAFLKNDLINLAVQQAISGRMEKNSREQAVYQSLLQVPAKENIFAYDCAIAQMVSQRLSVMYTPLEPPHFNR